MSSTFASLALSDVGSPRFLSAVPGLLAQRFTGSFFMTTAGGAGLPTVPAVATVVAAAVSLTLFGSGSGVGDWTDVAASALGIGASGVFDV